MSDKNPSLFDLIEMHVAEKYPKLVVDDWTTHGKNFADQIRISSTHVDPFGNTSKNSLVAMCNVHESAIDVYYVDDYKARNWRWTWNGPVKMRVVDREFFNILDVLIVAAIRNKEVNDELQKSGAYRP